MMRAARFIAAAAVMTALLPASVFADDGTAPPGAITATTMTLPRLLQLHERSLGMLPTGTAHTSVEVRAVKDGTLTGTQTEYVSGSDYRIDETLGVFQESEGKTAGKSWQHNRNGITRLLSGLHQRGDVNASALHLATLAGRSHDVTLLGEVKDPVDAYVVKVDPPQGRTEYLFYDKATFDLVREEDSIEGKRVTYTYDDFRVTNGVRSAWHEHRTNGVADNDLDWKTNTLTYGQAVDPATFAIPASSSNLTLSADRAGLPAKLSGDRIILTVQLGAHKVNLQLDSGASGILLNRAVADATGVQSFGSRTAETAGKYLASDALIPRMGIGSDAVMKNVAAETAPYVAETYDGSPVAGLIGYDFIAGAVMHIDYYNGTVEAISHALFKPPAGAIAIPIRLDDGVPVVDARIGAAAAHHFIVDTGADRSMIFSAFAAAHPADVSDQGLGQTMTAAYPFISQIYGVGGEVEVKPVQVASVTLGSIVLPKWLFDVSQDAPAFEGDDYDGLIGQDVLRNFDVYFDYEGTTMYLLPNERYRERYG